MFTSQLQEVCYTRDQTEVFSGVQNGLRWYLSVMVSPGQQLNIIQNQLRSASLGSSEQDVFGKH